MTFQCEYDPVIDFYYYEAGYEVYTNRYSGIGWGDKKVARNYLERYWLDQAIYQDKWEVLHNSIFDLGRQLPGMIFKKNFEFITLLGGGMFVQKDFEQLKACLYKVGDKEFIIIQDSFGINLKQLQYSFRMQYPADITWNKLMNGSFISAMLFDAYIQNYYLLGHSGQWGMYIANDYVDESVGPAGTPIRIIGFNSKHKNIFREAFEIPEGSYCENVDYIPKEERPNLKEWVPRVYRK